MESFRGVIMNPNEVMPTPEELNADEPKRANKAKAYVPPKLECLGSFLDLTAMPSVGMGLD